jgi:hypothetical protein
MEWIQRRSTLAGKFQLTSTVGYRWAPHSGVDLRPEWRSDSLLVFGERLS